MGANVRFILFDIGGVLANVDIANARETWSNHGFEPARFDHALLDSGAKAKGDRGDLDREGMRLAVEKALGQDISMEELQAIWGSMVSWKAEVPELLRSLRVPYGVLSTIDPIHATALGPLPGADPIVYSCDVGSVKPDRRIFEVAIQKCPVPVASVRYVDDLEENVAMGASLGLDAHHTPTLESLRQALIAAC